MRDEIDQEIVDRERSEQLATMADDYIANLDYHRAVDADAIEREIDRGLADLERETFREDGRG